MINKYLNLLTKEDLNLFSEKSKFIENKSNSESYAYFSIKVDGSNYKLPDNFEEIGKILYKLGAIGSPVRISNNDEDGFFAIDNIFFGKIELLKKILFEQEIRKNALLLDKITNKLIKQSIRPKTIIQLLNIEKDKIISFNDLEILIHAISIKYPEKLDEIINIFNISNKEIKNDIQKNIKYVIIRKQGIFDDKNNIIFSFSTPESIIALELKSKGMNLESLKNMTKQISTNAVSSSIKKIQNNIKRYKLENYIKLSFSRAEKVYHLEILKI